MAAIAGSNLPLIVITGPTASGKSVLAVELAEEYGGEIICADSRTIYKGMDIGTAKPSLEEQARVPHHLLDIVEPDERFTVHDFQQLARQTIVEIRTRGHIPFIVGGTGLYIDSVVLDYNFTNDDVELRRELSGKTVLELQSMIKTQHLAMPQNAQNKRHLVQSIVAGQHTPHAKKAPDDSTYVVAIATERATLEERIVIRVHEMFDSGVVDEARRLGEQYGWSSEALTGNIYPILKQVIDGELDRDAAIEKCIIRDRQLTKRQITWLKRHSFVQWKTLDEARTYLEDYLDGIRGRQAEL